MATLSLRSPSAGAIVIAARVHPTRRANRREEAAGAAIRIHDHIVGRSYSPRGGGKVESAMGTLKRELWECFHFEDRTEAERRLSAWVDDYNHRRAHMGIDGLVPADRFFGRADQVLARVAAILNAVSPDLSAFVRHGGKLVAYHGWGDAAVPPRDSIRYHEAVRAKMGDPGSFYRLFMAPGMLHCRGGAGPNELDVLSAVVDWVENGKAPERVLATKRAGDGGSGEIVRRRPLCPYPQQARWDGKGDKTKAESFVCGPS
jgi:hypothetical protein